MFQMAIWPLQLHAVQHDCPTVISAASHLRHIELARPQTSQFPRMSTFPTALSQLQTHLSADNELPSVVHFAPRLCAARLLAGSLRNTVCLLCLVDAHSFTHPPCLLVLLVLLKNSHLQQ